MCIALQEWLFDLCGEEDTIMHWVFLNTWQRCIRSRLLACDIIQLCSWDWIRITRHCHASTETSTTSRGSLQRWQRLHRWFRQIHWHVSFADLTCRLWGYWRFRWQAHFSHYLFVSLLSQKTRHCLLAFQSFGHLSFHVQDLALLGLVGHGSLEHPLVWNDFADLVWR